MCKTNLLLIVLIIYCTGQLFNILFIYPSLSPITFTQSEIHKRNRNRKNTSINTKLKITMGASYLHTFKHTINYHIHTGHFVSSESVKCFFFQCRGSFVRAISLAGSVPAGSGSFEGQTAAPARPALSSQLSGAPQRPSPAPPDPHTPENSQSNDTMAWEIPLNGPCSLNARCAWSQSST